MTGDDTKENKWAKALDDAGLLDDVEDAWELPKGEVLDNGATLEVHSTETSGPGVSIIESNAGPAGGRRDDETQKVITVISADPNSGSGEDTVRVSYAEDHTRDALRGEQERSRSRKMPLSPVRPSRPTSRTSVTDTRPHKDTNPAPLAHHARYSLNENLNRQPADELDAEAEIGWDSLLEDERSTREMPVYPNDAPSQSAEVTGDDEIDLEFDLMNDDEPPSNELSLDEPPSSRQEERVDPWDNTDGRERFERARGARISVPGLNDFPEEIEGSGMIMDVPLASVVPEPIDLEPPSPQILMAEKYDMNDFSGALRIAEQILEQNPDDLDAFQYRKSCRDRLLQIYEARIGNMDRVPELRVNTHELMWRNLDASAGFVLSRIDGVGSYADILDISGMPKFETCQILWQLLEDGLIE